MIFKRFLSEESTPLWQAGKLLNEATPNSHPGVISCSFSKHFRHICCTLGPVSWWSGETEWMTCGSCTTKEHSPAGGGDRNKCSVLECQKEEFGLFLHDQIILFISKSDYALVSQWIRMLDSIEGPSYHPLISKSLWLKHNWKVNYPEVAMANLQDNIWRYEWTEGWE